MDEYKTSKTHPNHTMVEHVHHCQALELGLAIWRYENARIDRKERIERKKKDRENQQRETLIIHFQDIPQSAVGLSFIGPLATSTIF